MPQRNHTGRRRRSVPAKLLSTFRPTRLPEDILSPGETMRLVSLVAGGAIVALAAGLLLILG